MRILKTLVAAAAFAGAASAASAVTIDDFSGVFGPLVANNDTQVGNQASAGAIGGNRAFSVTNDNLGVSDLGGNSTVNLGGGVFGFSNDSGETGMGMLLWDASGAGLGSADLTDGGLNDKFTLGVVLSDSPAIQYTIEVADGDSSGSHTFSGVGAGTTVDIAFALAGFGGIDFTDIESVKLAIDSNGVAAADASVNFFATTSSDVPLPAPALLLLAGLAGLGYASRKRA